jgi:hypothetical protein
MAARVLDELTEEEKYLACILADKSGIDIAEFCWQAPESEDNCFRAWPFQWGWWRCDDPLQIDQCSRSCGKSLSIKVRMFAFPFVFPGQEAVITAPELVHLEPIVQLVEQQFEATRLGREMRKKLPTHRPFMYEFLNGARIIGRIPQRDGKGVKGIHPLVLEQDEASDYPEPGWKELIETRLQGFAGSVWRSHGVTRGMGNDSFYKRSEHGQDDPPLRYRTRPGLTTVHRIVAMARPTWTDVERQEKIREYGSKEDPDYRRNILGSHGDAQSPIFVLSRLMKCVDDDPSSENNTEDFWHVAIKDTEIGRMREMNPKFDLLDLFLPPPTHASFKTIWMGADIGWTTGPTEILIAAEYKLEGEELRISRERKKSIPKGAVNRMKIIGRVTLNRIAAPDQVEIFMHLVDLYKPKVFAMDATGAGLPLFQAFQRRMEDVADHTGSARARQAVNAIRGYNFSSKILAEFDESIEDDPKWTLEDKIREKGIKRDVLELSTDVLRDYVDDERLWLPWDLDLIQQFRAQTFTINRNSRDQYGRKRIFSSGNFHALDAARMLALGHKQFALESMLREKPPATEPVLDIFMSW